MSLSDLAAIGTLVGGIAVLASLIFVGVELRQNTRAVRATASQAHTANWQQIMNTFVENADVALLWRNGLKNLESLADDDRIRFIALASGIFRFWEGARLQWRHGQLDAEHWQNVRTCALDFASQPGLRAYWHIRRHWHSADFQEWFEALPMAEAHAPYDK
jgi:hypothetical protein